MHKERDNGGCGIGERVDDEADMQYSWKERACGGRWITTGRYGKPHKNGEGRKREGDEAEGDAGLQLVSEEGTPYLDIEHLRQGLVLFSYGY